MNNPTQSKPTYNIQEGTSSLDINRLTDRVSQSSSAKALNVKEEVEALVSSDQGFVRTLSNAINTLPSAGGVQDNEISQPRQTFNFDEGSFTVPENLTNQTFGVEVPASVAPQVDAPTTINPPENNFSNNSDGKVIIKEELEVDNNTGISNLQGDFQSMKSELEGLAQRIKSELSSVTKAIGSVAEILPIPNPLASSSPRVGDDVTGAELLEIANQVADERAPEGVDIRFERLADGKFQQYINGSKGEIYSEQEIRGFINKGESGNEANDKKEDSDRVGYGNTDNKNADTADKNESNNASKPDNSQSIDESNAKTPKTSTDGFNVSIDLTGELVFAGDINKFEIWDKISEYSENSDGLALEYTVADRTTEFIDEYITPQNLSDLIVFSSTEPKYQIGFKVPLAKKDDDGGWMPLTQGGYYSLSGICIDGVHCIFPNKII